MVVSSLICNNKTTSKGDVFWYKVKKDTYGAIVLDVLGKHSKYYLVAISEKIDDKKIDVNTIVSSPLYTVAWFSDVDMLSKRRIHICGTLNICDNYNNRAGFAYEENESVTIYNCGQSLTWKHQFRSFSFPSALLNYVLSSNNLPKTRK